MKAFLMYRNRDLDPQQLLIRREKDSRHSRGAEQGLSLQQALPWNEAALRQDLGLGVLFKAMSLGDNFLFEAAQVAVLSSLTDLEVIRYRQHILADSLKNSAIVQDIYQIAMEAIEGETEELLELLHPLSRRHTAKSRGGAANVRRHAEAAQECRRATCGWV